ncbi:tRNA-splicing endonuclease subunit Sen2 [Fopius arisanus]|uniref:tRNA-intron lyase n=1 Tax=Fopius arisanus TaxID=64838 RepID=A0A9R1TZN8_9HYME|nr:PREDICTED: tRNA-splicing endonuclease subunit Sen2 [Fopius arisanus]
MNLKEPVRKKRVRQRSHGPFPIPFNKDDKWVMYTAHLSASGTCIAHPEEMAAVYCMGFFGKGSLSRGFPSFGKRRFGAPPQIRERQWKRRKRWLEDVKKLQAEPFVFRGESGVVDLEPNIEGSEEFLEPSEGDSGPKSSGESSKGGEEASGIVESHKSEKNGEQSSESEEKIEENNSEGQENSKDLTIITNLSGEHDKSKENDEISTLDSSNPENAPISQEKSSENHSEPLEIKEIQEVEITQEKSPRAAKTPGVAQETENSREIDEVVLDSTEEEEVLEIMDPNKSGETDSQDDICVLNEEISKPDNFLEFLLPQEKPQVNPNEILVLPDSDEDTEDYLKNIKPRIETEGFPVSETLQLTFEETFFLMYGLGCLQVVNYDGQIFSIIEAWRHFNEQDEGFFSKYVVYHYFRSKGWVVKPGLKCAGDFVLYKKGPQFYHASYVIFVEVVDGDNLLRDDTQTKRDTSWMNIHCLNRLAQSVAKELLIVQVLWPSTVPRNSSPVPLEALSEFTVRELLMRRWNPNETCDAIPLDEEDEDSEDEDSS